MVVTVFPATVETCVVQDRVGWPLIWTVQAPHSAMPQPNLVPVMPRAVAQDPQQGHLRDHVHRLRFSVQGKFDCSHGASFGDTSLSIQTERGKARCYCGTT